ncbi:MAG TPA: hypothetical protein VGA56_06020 [Opitutaceae bacterium]
MNSKLLSTLAAISSLTLATSTGWSEILVAQTRTSAVIYGGATYLVDFNGAAAGGTTFNFTTTEPNTRIVIMFNAEAACANTSFHWVDVDIIVNPAGAAGDVVVPPTNGDNAFVSGNETDSDFLYASGDGWVSAAAIATMVVPTTGVHTVRVRVNGAHSGIARFDDMSLIVMK